jgi:hypothetical protein
MKQRRYRLDTYYDEDQYEMVPEMVKDDAGDWMRYADVALLLGAAINITLGISGPGTRDASDPRQQLDSIVEQLRQIEREMNESDASVDVDIATAICLLESES